MRDVFFWIGVAVIVAVAYHWWSGNSAPDPTTSAGPPVLLRIAPDPQRGRDGITGEHILSLEPLDVGGDRWRVGCVPCFNAITLVGVSPSGQAFALNGSTMSRSTRLTVVDGGAAAPVRDWARDLAPAELLGRAMQVKGCAAGAREGSLDRTFRAISAGTCM